MGRWPEGMLEWGGDTPLTTWEFKHCTIYKKMFYHVNTLLGSLIESCKGLVQMRDPPHPNTHTKIQILLALY